MPSLTPEHRNAEVSGNAMREGLLNGLFTLIPTTAGVYAAVQKSSWMRTHTNMQSRTALCIMPALFVFALTSEERVFRDMQEMASQNQHSHESVQWAEKQISTQQQWALSNSGNNDTQTQELTDLYRRAVYQSGVRVVPGNQLSWYHAGANYVSDNPVKILASLAVPGVVWIFYGRSGQQHLTLSMKLMHTRVFGQFATISALLGIIGFKEMIDRQGKFITEAQAEARVEQMKEMRQQMMSRLEAKQQAQQAYNDAIRKAHKEDIQAGQGVKHKQVKNAGHVEVSSNNTIAVSPKE